MIKVYLVEDQALVRDAVAALLSLDFNIEVIGQASNGQDALNEMNSNGQLKCLQRSGSTNYKMISETEKMEKKKKSRATEKKTEMKEESKTHLSLEKIEELPPTILHFNSKSYREQYSQSDCIASNEEQSSQTYFKTPSKEQSTQTDAKSFFN